MFQVLFINIRSLREKILELEQMVNSSSKRPHLIVVNETWLMNSEANKFNINGFIAVHNCRSRRGGGTCMFIRRDLRFKVVMKITRYNTTLIEVLSLTPKIKVLTTYRSPDENVSRFINFLGRLLDKHKNLIFLSDTNLDLLTSGPSIWSYVHTFTSNNFYLANEVNVSSCTRVTGNTRSLIDHILLDIEDARDKVNVELLNCRLSDHKMLKCEIPHIEEKNFLVEWFKRGLSSLFSFD